MSEPIVERLSRFTPDAAGLDRDALLFAAGRSSARPNRGWMALASALAVTQAVSLAVMFLPASLQGRVPSIPSPLAGEGQGGGGKALAKAYPPPQPSPARGEGERGPSPARAEGTREAPSPQGGREDETLPAKGAAFWLAHHRLPDLDSEEPAASSGTLVESEPPLRALARPESVLN